MKTPEEIAQQTLNDVDLGGLLGEGTPKTAYDLTHAIQSGWIEGDTVMDMIQAAIQADRAQHATERRLARGLGPFGWDDFEEDESTDAIPGKYILTIECDGEEYASIVHRTVDGLYPIDGELANEKRERAQRIVDALNETTKGETA